MAKRTPAATPKAPDLIGKAGRVQQVAQHLGQIQAMKENLEIAVVRHGLKPTDPAPGYRDKTVKQERDDLAGQEERLVKRYAPLLSEVQKLVAGNSEEG